MCPKIPIEEHPGRDDPLIITVTVVAVVLAIELAELSLPKYWRQVFEASVKLA